MSSLILVCKRCHYVLLDNQCSVFRTFTALLGTLPGLLSRIVIVRDNNASAKSINIIKNLLIAQCAGLSFVGKTENNSRFGNSDLGIIQKLYSYKRAI